LGSEAAETFPSLNAGFAITPLIGAENYAFSVAQRYGYFSACVYVPDFFPNSVSSDTDRVGNYGDFVNRWVPTFSIFSFKILASLFAKSATVLSTADEVHG
jgi:hypothetical protein